MIPTDKRFFGLWLALALGVGALVPLAPALGAESQAYLGVGWGRFEQESELALTSSEHNNATKFFFGYELTRFLGVEAGFAGFNDLTFDLGGGSSAHVENESYYLTGRLQLPLWRADDYTVVVYAGGGAHRWDATETTRDSSGAVTGRGRAHETSPVYTGGILLRGERSASLRLDYEVFADVGTANEADLRLISINILAYF